MVSKLFNDVHPMHKVMVKTVKVEPNTKVEKPMPKPKVESVSARRG